LITAFAGQRRLLAAVLFVPLNSATVAFAIPNSMKYSTRVLLLDKEAP
jgi:hypothetical protein